MKRIQVKVPGSCGELIQGFYGRSESLVSYAIDCYTTVTIEPAKNYELKINHYNEKALIALKKACDHFNVDIGKIHIKIESEIPIGKGMASSTADIVGVLVAVASYANKDVDPVWLGQVAASIEPTDNIMFENWILFDHLNGEVVESLEWIDGLKVIVLEMDQTIDTKKLRETGAFDKSTKPKPSRALDLLRGAIKNRDLALLGKAMNLSALENQSVLHKPYLDLIIELATECGMIGVNTSHSGTVLGVVFTADQDPSVFLEKARGAGIFDAYSKHYIHNIIIGGPQVNIIEDHKQ